MAKKENASTRISANGGTGVFHTSSKGKDKHFLQTDRPLVFVKNPNKKLRVAFSNYILSRFQAGRMTGVSTSTVCPFVAWSKKRGAIWSCGRHRDPFTGQTVEFLTMNRAMAVDYYKGETEDLWQVLSESEREIIIKSIDAYLDRPDLGVFHSSSIEDDSVREVWLKVQDRIDSQMAEIRAANERRRMSVYQDL